jgi:hypothetical protein
MTKQKIIDLIYRALVEVRLKHPCGLRAVGSGNAHEFFTRWGVPGPVAERCRTIIELLEEDYGGLENPMELIDLLKDGMRSDGTLKQPPGYNCEGVAPGERDEHGLCTHPDLLFTAVNHNGRRYGIEADASGSPRGGLAYYQDWRDADEIRRENVRVITAWDAQEGRMLTDEEIQLRFHAQS